MAYRENLGNEPGTGRESEPRTGMEGMRSPGAQKSPGVTEQAKSLTGKVKNQAKNVVEGGKSRAASQIDRVSDRIDDRADQMELEGGLKGQAGKMMHKAGDVLENTAGYLRTHDIGTISDDLKGQIRSHPYLSVGAALGAGFVLGRVLAGEEEEEESRFRERELRMRPIEREWRGGSNWKGQLGNALMGGLSGMVEHRMRGRC